jgi:hypothetical protein
MASGTRNRRLAILGDESTGESSNTQADADTVAARYLALEKERDKLLARIQLNNLGEEVRTLRRQAEARTLTREPIDIDDQPSGEGQSVGSKRSRDELHELDDVALPVRKRFGGGDPKVERPEKYRGGMARKLKEYILLYETAFRLLPDAYPTDAIRVLYAQQFLTGETLDAWLRYADNLEGGVPPMWEEYKGVLRDQLQDLVTRAATLVQRYDDARQKPH